MTLAQSEFRKLWQQVPDQYIWRNAKNGEFVSVNGSTDQAWYVVKRTKPVPKDGGMGSVTTEVISPYYLLPTKTVGRMGTESRARVRENENWMNGTFEDALNSAYRYMRHFQDRKSVRAIQKSEDTLW